jgi:outer membrane receptor for ferrienterochelin and colicin
VLTAARGDVGAYNLRNMGVGNTLTLLNGRRLVNNAGYQTELLGGTMFLQ